MFDIATFKSIFYTYTYYVPDVLYSNINCNSINKKIKLLRLKNGLTQLQFGNLINKKSTTIAKWEQGIQEPYSKSLKSIITAFNLPSDFFEFK
ncbi:helix-turn-helix domain-containing protein [Clostridium paraputrificum]|uniref:helix-turn-helix domain-containing protein n=1 Tax=Clostridium TaxID=1485 RepID=UPI00396710D3